MDMLMIDVTELIAEGDVVVVLVKLKWITLLKIKYNSYEILTNISQRVKRIFSGINVVVVLFSNVLNLSTLASSNNYKLKLFSMGFFWWF
jgi:hypothetical protein